MNISNETINILKNYTAINQSILFKEGSTLSTISVAKNIFARATIDEDIPQDFGIYDLNEFLSTLSLFSDADLAFSDTHVDLTGSDAQVQYFFADPSIIVSPTKEIEMPECEVSFALTKSVYSKLMKAAGVLQLNDLRVRSDGDKIVAEVLDKKNDTSNTYALDVNGDFPEGASFNFYFRVENMKMMEGDYTVIVSSKNISKFDNANGKITYWIALEPDSTFEEA